MAATTTRRPAAAQAYSSHERNGRTGEAATSTPRAAALLAIALVAAAVYAAFASGSIDLPQQTYLEIGVAAIALTTLAALLYGRGLRIDAPSAAKWGVGLLAGFAAWSGLSVAWSVAPDLSWLAANRALAFALLAALGIVAGSSVPRAAERAALALLGVVTLIALYALGGKIAPAIHIGGLIDLNHTDRFSRLRAPLDYWNALAMVCVLAVPIAMRVATEARYHVRWRAAGLVSLVLLLTTLALTYSRGGLIVGVVAVVLVIAVGPGRLPLTAALGAGLLGTIPPAVIAFSLKDLTTDGVPVADRTGDGLIFMVALLFGVALAVVAGSLLVRRLAQVEIDRAGIVRARRAAAIVIAALLVLVIGGLALSNRGIRGTISHQADEFTKPKIDRQNDPARVLRTNSGNRWVWWQEAVSGFRGRPVAGYGAGSFPITHRLYRKNILEVRQPHSVPLQFLTETGLVGTLLGLGGLALLAVVATRMTLARAAGSERAFAAALLAGVMAWLVHLWVDWDWDIPGVTLPVMVMLGLLCARPRTLGAPIRSGTVGRGAVLALGVAGAAVAVALAALPAISSNLTSSALSRADGGTPADLRAGEEKAALAKRLNPFTVEPLFAQASIAQRGNQPAAAGRLLTDAVDRQPDNPDTWGRLLRFQEATDDAAGSLTSIRNLLALDLIAAIRTSYFSSLAPYDPARSASAIGTPLPEKVAPVTPKQTPTRNPAKPKVVAPATPAPTQQTPTTPAPTQTPTPAPTPTPTPTPAPTPAPAPKATPKPAPQGDPFRLEG